MHDHLFVITGGPGSGKTSLIEALSRRGFHSMPEAGRAIIQDQMRIGGTSLPWVDISAFSELMLAWDLRSHREALALRGRVIMDRAIPDIAGYLTLCGLPIPTHIEVAARLFSYNKHVFIAPYWDEIFTQDAERKQDRREAEATALMMSQTYTRFGYKTVEIPKVNIEDRADFIERYLSDVY